MLEENNDAQTNHGIAYFQMDKNPNKKLVTKEDYAKLASSTYESANEYFSIVYFCCGPLRNKACNAIVSIAAFTCELYMKSIIYFDQCQQSFKHNLYDLFCMMPQLVKDEIIDKHPCKNTSRDNFMLEMEEIGKAFEILRYSHEKSTLACNVLFILELMATLKVHCDSKFQPEK